MKIELKKGKITLKELAKGFKIFGQILLNHIRPSLIYNVRQKTYD